MPPTGRHAAPRSRARRPAALPLALLSAAGCALGGLALVPADAGAAAPGEPPRPVQTHVRPLEPLHALSLTATVEAGRQRARAQAVAEAAAALRRQERVSRDRPVRPPAAAVAPAPVVTPVRPPAAAVAPARAVAPAPRPSFVRPGVGALTSRYGARWGRLHAGIDLAAGTGSPISAVAAGTVLSAGVEGGYGQIVRLQHDDGTVTLYAHLSALLVTKDQRVTTGTYVGREGSTGHSTGPHLHFEVRVGGTPVDPVPWLLARGVNPTQP